VTASTVRTLDILELGEKIFRPDDDYDREEIERVREFINLGKKVLAESDPSILLGVWYKPEPPSDSQ
jgi:hypothetical protein